MQLSGLQTGDPHNKSLGRVGLKFGGLRSQRKHLALVSIKSRDACFLPVVYVL